ncbi:MAG: DNA phosphorothioation-dependent restriction protein DptG [Campylobacterota bacterium]|nr:DNA phosphorothioation-dependent restriction protein DptG [Campylobacterota bacterium]
MIDKLQQIDDKVIGDRNLTPSTFYPFSNKDTSPHLTYDLQAIIGLLVSHINHTTLPKSFEYNNFKESCLAIFEAQLTDPSAKDILEAVFFPSDSIPLISLVLFQAYSADNKSQKVFNVIFKRMLKQNSTKINFDSKLNFLEERIVNQFKELLIKSDEEVSSSSYLPYMDELFTQDIEFLAGHTHYFTQHAQKFLSLYLFLYASQLALNLNPNSTIFKKPKSHPLYFILNYEKASAERKHLVNEGYQNLYDHAKYLFPYLSFLETLINISGNLDLRFYDFFSQFEENKETIEALEAFEQQFRQQRNLSQKAVKYSTLEEALKNLLDSVMEQFQDPKTSRNSIFEKYRRVFERQIADPFVQGRQRFGKVLVFEQDTIILLTNIAIAKEKQMRFQDLLVEFEKRGIYFDQQSRIALIELYERVGNIDKKSDSGDAVYVKTTL